MDRRGALARSVARERRRRSWPAVTPTGSGRQQLYGKRSASLARRTVWSESCTRSSRSRASGASRSRARRRRSLPARRSSRTGWRRGRRRRAGRSLPRAGAGSRLQWCHGAPGMVATAAPYLDEELLLAGAELTWRAGRAPGGEGRGSLPRHFRERLRALEDVRAHRRRALAGAGAQLRRPRARAGRGSARPATRCSPAVSASPSSQRRASTPIARFPVLDGWD